MAWHRTRVLPPANTRARYALAPRERETGRHWVSGVQEQPAALSVRHTVPELGSEAAPADSWLRSGLQVLWRDVNSVRAGRAVSQSHLNPAHHSESLVPLVNGKLAPNFASLGKSPSGLLYQCPQRWRVVVSLPPAGQRQGMQQEPRYAPQAQQAMVSPTQQQHFHGRVGSQGSERASLPGQGSQHHSGCLLPALQKSPPRRAPSCKDQGSPASSPPVASAESPAVRCMFEALARTHLELGTSSSPCRGSGMRRARSEASKNV